MTFEEWWDKKSAFAAICPKTEPDNEAYLCAKRAWAAAMETVKDTLRPFAALGGPGDGFAAAFHDLEDDVVVYSNSGQSITAGDVRAARKMVSPYVQPPANAMRHSGDPDG